jgi:hypothetical protein
LASKYGGSSRRACSGARCHSCTLNSSSSASAGDAAVVCVRECAGVKDEPCAGDDDGGAAPAAAAAATPRSGGHDVGDVGDDDDDDHAGDSGESSGVKSGRRTPSAGAAGATDT